MVEMLLCVPTHQLMSLPSGFTPMDAPKMLEQLPVDRLWLGPRPHLETDESYRQLVSYVVIQAGRRFLTYRRSPRGGESRLHGLLSIGVGGHVNFEDVRLGSDGIDLLGTLENACRRELDEELGALPVLSLRPLVLLFESSNPVARVHLGTVVHCVIEDRPLTATDQGLSDLRFMTVPELQAVAPEMETWSSSLLPHLATL
jgi:predicted NUDIX family phosphoesterase